MSRPIELPLKVKCLQGQKSNQPEKDLGKKVVKSLVEGLENQQHQVYFDTYNISYALMRELRKSVIPDCKAINLNRKFLLSVKLIGLLKMVVVQEQR